VKSNLTADFADFTDRTVNLANSYPRDPCNPRLYLIGWARRLESLPWPLPSREGDSGARHLTPLSQPNKTFSPDDFVQAERSGRSNDEVDDSSIAAVGCASRLPLLIIGTL
jgi:hypothetical protein